MRTVSLHCLAGPLKDQTFRLTGGPVFIFGRYVKATCSLAADAAASNLHFLIDTSDDRIRIIDLGSTNGLVINDKHLGGKQGPPFSKFIPIKSGDTILAGSSLFRVQVTDEATEDGFAAISGGGANALYADGKRGAAGNFTAILPKNAADATQPADYAKEQEPQLGEDGLPRVAGFTILEKIGGGGRGVVYKAVKDDTGAATAIKMMNFNRTKGRRSIEMFRREIQMTRQLHHPNIIRYLDDGISGGAPYLALEYVEGGILDDLIRNADGGRLALPNAVPLFIQLLEAVSYMHSLSLVHRDIKPQNILLDVRRGGSLAVKLSDMGLSCRFTSEDASEFLPIISEGGTPAYMPPEQLTDLTRAIPQSDVFSSAATFYHMLTGSLLYNFKGREQNDAILEGAITPLHTLRPDLPPAIVQVVDKALSYNPEERYENAQEMLDAFKKALE